jgi:hypothetical protein
MVFPVPEIMLQIISVALQLIVVFILCLPSRPPALRYAPNILLAYLMVRYPTVLIRYLALLLVVYLKLNNHRLKAVVV